MPRPRSQLVDLAVTRYYHCMSRCVRQAFLLGDDAVSGYNFDHRKVWLADRMGELTSIFAVDVCSYGLLSNHFHLIPRLDPERALGWSDDEVADRYAKLFPPTVALARQFAAVAFAERVAEWRKRLSSLSWFMRCLNESIARRANREDGCRGRFYEGRFRSQALLDVGALMTCMAYVDLNPIRAGISTTLEDSGFTSIRERLLAAAQPGATQRLWLLPFTERAPDHSGNKRLASGHPTNEVEQFALQAADAPIDSAMDGSKADSFAAAALTGIPIEPLPIDFDDYEQLLRWTVAEIREQRACGDDGPRMARDDSRPLPRLLDDLHLDADGFIDTIKTYSRRFFTMVGSVQVIDLEANRRGYRRRPGIGGAARLYRASG